MSFRFGYFANLAQVGILGTSKAGERRELCCVNQKRVSDRPNHVVVEPDSVDLAQDQALRPVAHFVDRVACTEHGRSWPNHARKSLAFHGFCHHVDEIEFRITVGNPSRRLRNLFAMDRVGQMDDEIGPFFDVDPSVLLRTVRSASDGDHGQRWIGADAAEEGERCEIPRSVAVVGEDPGNGAWNYHLCHNAVHITRAEFAQIKDHRHNTPFPKEHARTHLTPRLRFMQSYAPVARVIKASFLERPNRFIVFARHKSLGRIKAFMPNPGRLWELLFPNVTLYLTRNKPPKNKNAKAPATEFTVVAVERDGEPVFLHTHWNNHAARWLLENHRIRGLENADVVRGEVKHGRSRFDFLMRQGQCDFFLEVKSCTLFGNRVAMFPDAITDRGRRHMEELAELGSRGAKPCVLLLVQTQNVDYFMPDYHTDLAFSETFLRVREEVRILPVAVRWDNRLQLSPEVQPLEIPWDYLCREVKDQGSYLLLMRLNETCHIPIGSLGEIEFPAGHYVYIGSAMKNLTARVTRHQRRRKTMHWHVDYLRQYASDVVPLPIRSSKRLECELAASFGQLLKPVVPGFGSSDCQCDTHLLWQKADPLNDPEFHTILQRYRMARPE